MKFFFHIIKTVALLSMIFACLGCGDDGADDYPFWISADDSTIDWANEAEDGISSISTTLFDDKGRPLTDGTMFFTLNASARGWFVDDEGKRVKSVSRDIEDGVCDVSFVASHSPEIVTIKAYCPRFPSDASVSTRVRVYNSALAANRADFDVRIDSDNSSLYHFYDLSEYPEGTSTGTGNLPGAVTWNWTFTDSAGGPYVLSGATEEDFRDPSFIFASGLASASLSITVGGVTTDVVGITFTVE